MSRTRVMALTRRILQQFRRDHRTLGLIFVAPIVILSLIGYLVRNQTYTPPDVAVVNLDAGQMGGRAVTELARIPTTKNWAVLEDRNVAQRQLEHADIGAYVVLPPDFSTSTLAGNPHEEIHLEGTDVTAKDYVTRSFGLVLLQTALDSQTGGPRVPTNRPDYVYLHGGPNLDQLDLLGAAMIGFVVFFLTYIVTAITFLRERTQGTLERLMASPFRRAEIVAGYMLGLLAVALAQAVVVVVFALYVIKVHNAGSVFLVFILVGLMALAAINIGIFLSMFARNEFQAVQFIPLVIVPQVLLSGLLFPVNGEPFPLQYVSNVLPLTYAVYGLRDVMLKGAGINSPALLGDIGVLVAFALVTIAAASATLRRRIA
jgi:ABC-2 type transport system permease protein